MSIIELIFLGVGLAMDCFAISMTQGLTRGHYRGWSKPILMAALFGVFQAGMPLIGYFAGVSFADYITQYDHWIALALLSFIGGKMIVDGMKDHLQEKRDAQNHSKHEIKEADFRFKTLILLAIATSIDALATGIIFIPTPEILWLAVGIIGGISLLFALLGYGLGVGVGKKLNLHAEIWGGIILVGIGIKICLEHILN